MSDIPLYDEDQDIEPPRPRAEVRFTGVQLKPYADGRRVKLNFTLTPFEERPSVEAVVFNDQQQPVASLSLIEALDIDFDFTIHLRGPEPRGAHTLQLTLYYPVRDDDPAGERQVVHVVDAAFDVQPPG